MKPRPSSNPRAAIRNAVARRAFTLVEMMVSVSIFTMVTGGIIYSHLVGTKMYNLAIAKMGGSDQARAAVGTLLDDIRNGKIIWVGTGGLTNFTSAADGTTQQGNAIQIWLTPNTTNGQFVRYYLDTNTAKLVRTVNGLTAQDLVAQNVTNTIVFASEDYTGAILTSSQNNRVIHFILQFYQIQYPVLIIGTNKGSFDYYQISGRITRRALE
jgi:prepilin-type N-terminal cleavage/methylation domain-containing protein